MSIYFTEFGRIINAIICNDTIKLFSKSMFKWKKARLL